MDFKSSPTMYIIAACIILFVLAQAVFFLVKAWKQGKAIGMSKEKLLNVVTSSTMFTLPSALSVLATVIALAPALGLVLPWVRLSVIGNLMYESTAAEAAMEAFGHEGGIAVSVTDPVVFAGIAWIMTLGICLSLVLLPFLAKPLNKKMRNLNRKEESVQGESEDKKSENKGISGFMNLVSPAVFIGIIGAFVARAIAGAGKPETTGDGAGVLSVVTLVTAVAVSLALEFVAKKFKLSKFEPFVMPIGMIIAMVVAVAAFNILPPEIATFEWRG
ncbi:MAG: DUF5058 family protein [Candidatus Fimenecus sp.]